MLNFNKDIDKVLKTIPVINQIVFSGIHPRYIIDIICNIFNVSFEELRLSCKKREFTIPRHMLCYLIKKYSKKEKINYDGTQENDGLTLKDIAAILNKKRHSTIKSSIKEVENMIETDKGFKEKIEMIEKELKQYLKK